MGEELWIAQRSDEVDVGGGIDDDGFYVGSGTRDRIHGFLAHGGAGGMPVFIGGDSVEGAEEECEREDVPHPRDPTAES